MSRRSLAPALLLSMPQMCDPNFARTVVLLCKHNDDGAFGLVVNRPLVTTGRVIVNLDPPIETERELEVWIGGPVEPQTSWMLVGDDDEPGGRGRISDGVYLSTSPDRLSRLLEPNPPPRTRLIVGYSGWGAGSARSRAPALRLAVERRERRFDLLHASRANVGDRDSPSRRRSRRAPDVARRALTATKTRHEDTRRMSTCEDSSAALAFAALCGAVAIAQGGRVSEAERLQRMAARFAPTEIRVDLSKLSRRRSSRAGEARRSIEDHGRAVSPSGVGRATKRCWPSSSGDQTPAGSRSAALFPDQQGPVVASRCKRAVRSRRASEARWRQLLSRRYRQGRPRDVDRVAARRTRRRPRPASSPSSAAAWTAGCRVPYRTASNTKMSSFAPRRYLREAAAADRPSRR